MRSLTAKLACALAVTGALWWSVPVGFGADRPHDTTDDPDVEVKREDVRAREALASPQVKARLQEHRTYIQQNKLPFTVGRSQTRHRQG